VTIIGSGPVALDVTLAKMQRQRRIALRLPHFFAALSIVAQSDLVASLPASVARRFAQENGLVVLQTPVETPTVDIVAFWPPALDTDPASRWLRSVVRAAAKDMSGVLPAQGQ
jgi:DNA-binding transcriptional LysR family regulator